MPHPPVLPFLACEGPTDRDFLLPIILRTFEEIAAAIPVEVIPQDPETVRLFSGNGRSFEQSVRQAAAEAERYGNGCVVLCVPKDADSATGRQAHQTLWAAFAAVTQPADAGPMAGFAAVAGTDPPVCHKLVALVPVHEMEAWVMADKPALLAAMQTTLPLPALGLDHAPESYSNPKQALTDALAVARKHGAPPVTRTDLYQQLGQSLTPAQLAAVPSYRAFREAVRAAFRQLGYLR